MNAIEMALKMEQEAIEFYKQCAEKTTNPVGKKMFLSIVEDEMYHAACALQVQKGQTFSPARTTPAEDMKKLFDQNKDALLQQVVATADELEALKVGMKMEEDAINFYKKVAGEAANAQEKAFFDCLIADEEEHYKIFKNTYTFLEDTGNWFMWEQQGIVEG
ncbi:MAG: DUF2202 domain-containing protein [Nitrospirae bacterium]|nr:MAG: DUF2202 domain-containing protein [Nitrospirota bacterium]